MPGSPSAEASVSDPRFGTQLPKPRPQRQHIPAADHRHGSWRPRAPPAERRPWKLGPGCCFCEGPQICSGHTGASIGSVATHERFQNSPLPNHWMSSACTKVQKCKGSQPSANFRPSSGACSPWLHCAQMYLKCESQVASHRKVARVHIRWTKVTEARSAEMLRSSRMMSSRRDRSSVALSLDLQERGQRPQ